jgi:hypothetical protein
MGAIRRVHRMHSQCHDPASLRLELSQPSLHSEAHNTAFIETRQDRNLPIQNAMRLAFRVAPLRTIRAPRPPARVETIFLTKSGILKRSVVALRGPCCRRTSRASLSASADRTNAQTPRDVTAPDAKPALRAIGVFHRRLGTFRSYSDRAPSIRLSTSRSNAPDSKLVRFAAEARGELGHGKERIRRLRERNIDKVVGDATSQANGKAIGGVDEVVEDALNKQWLFPATFSPN